MLLLLFESIR